MTAPRTAMTPYWRCHGTGKRDDEPCSEAGENWRDATKHMADTGHGITTGMKPKPYHKPSTRAPQTEASPGVRPSPESPTVNSEGHPRCNGDGPLTRTSFTTNERG